MRGHREQPPEGDRSLSPTPDFGDDFFEKMVASANDAVITADADGTIVYANEAVEDLLGYAPTEVRGRQFGEFVPDRLRDRYDGWFDRYTEGDDGTPLDDETYEVTWVTADGEEMRLSVSGFVHVSDGQQLFTGFVREARDPDASTERLREEEALIEEIFDTSPIAVTVRGADRELLRANERAAELVGVGSDQLLYENDGEDEEEGWTVYDTEGEPLTRDEYPVSHAYETGEPVYNEEVIVEQPSSKRVHLSVNAAPVKDDGEVKRVVSAAEDITELKETQFELERRHEELETELSEVFSRIADAFFALNDDWQFTYVNDEAEELLLSREEDLLGENVWEVFSEAEGTTFQRKYERAMETQEPVSFVEYYRPLSTWFEVRAYPSETGLSVYFRDVTERKEREQELERYETIVETVEDGIYTVGTDGTFSMVNSAFTEITGYDDEELIGTRPSRFYDEDIEATIEQRQREILAGELSSATVEHDLETADGDTLRVEVTFVARPTDDGHERIGVLRDVTERKERERELRNRVKQQRAVAEFSQAALTDRSLDDLFDEAVELVCETLGHDYCKVLELFPEDGELLLRNGVGWDEGIVGSATVADDRGSQAGYTLISDEPVVVENLETDDRFSGPELLETHGVKSGISTVIGSPDGPWGILGTHHTETGTYADHDVQFVQSIAHILSTAIRRRERERELERYETIVETIDDGVYALDSDERFVMVNDAFCEMTGYDREQLVGEPASTVHSEAISETAAEMSETAADRPENAVLEFDLQTTDGDTIPVETRFGPYRYDETRFARTGVVRDVTQRKWFEQTLTALHESSRELLQLETESAVSESVLRTAADVLGIEGAAIYLWDDEEAHLVPTANTEYVADIFGDLPAFEPGDTAITWEAFADGRTIAFDDVRETDLTHREDTPLRSGIWIPLGSHGVLAVVSEEVAGFGSDEKQLADLLAATAEAALDRVERERERREHERKLEEQNERLDAFASMLAHELRNPLEIAQIYLDMGVERAVGEGDDGSAFREVERALDRIEEMIETLLVVTRRGGSVDTTEVLNLGEVAREWWDDLDPDGTLAVETDREILADPSRLRQLLENLYRNSEEHGGPNADVRVGDLEDGFYVEDDGPGIPPEERADVFEPGYSSSNVGIGFGLAVVEQLVEAHGWDCEITESESGGARFEFTNVEFAEK
ncbi:PAS domain S-box protein [Halorussus salinisoli]|uniref:PAS domain S-box protein n=1 Tax=Halorussus salinisoli TaxID=2558242 RepID=UPI0010C1FC2C|nr:PAS domain S-box protein [Halorussus salinisoli]